ncbi:potassium channel family protein [Candidatus Margulisiibacteriota bacterium]
MKSIAVIGLGQFGYQIAINLTQKGFEIIAIDKDQEVISEIKELVTNAIVLDSTDEKAMRAVNVDHVDKAIVAIGTNVQSSLLTTALLIRMNVNEIYVRAINPLQESILTSMGINYIINIEKEMGMQLANSLVSEGVGKYIEISDRHSLLEVKVPAVFVGKTLRDMNLRSRFQINVVGIKAQDAHISDGGDVLFRTKMTDIPDPDYALKKDDTLVIVGTDTNISKFLQEGKPDE